MDIYLCEHFPLFFYHFSLMFSVTKNVFFIIFRYIFRPYLCYLFPPFSLLPRVLQKIQVEQVEALIVAPYWPTQPWFSQILSLAAQKLLIYKPSATNLILSQDPKAKHALAEKLSLIVAVSSGKNIGH